MIIESLVVKKLRKDYEKAVKIPFQEAGTFILCRVTHRMRKTFNQMSADLDRADQQRKRMTSDITHDLSTPLQIVSGNIEMLDNGNMPLTPKRTNIIQKELERLQRLVSDLRTLSEIESSGLDIHPQPLQAPILMERIFQAYQPIGKPRNIELQLDVPGSNPSILVDEGRMMQVLRNLVEDALRYTPDRGWIKLSTSYDNQVHMCMCLIAAQA